MTAASRSPEKSPRRSRRARVLTGAGAVVLLLAALATAFALLHGASGRARAELVVHPVKYERLDQTVEGGGDLTAIRNSDIRCRVKAGSRNGTIATIIKWVVEDGTHVRGPRPDKPTGDLLVELDDSGFQEALKTQRVTAAKAESDKIQSEEAYKIAVSQNDSDIKTAETQLELAALGLVKYTGLSKKDVLKPETQARLAAELKAAAGTRRPTAEIAKEDLKKYKTGDYLAALKDAMGQVETARSDLEQQEDREAWAYRMVRKGYQTANQAQAETSRKDGLLLTLNKQALALDVLVRYTKVSQLTQYLRALEEARRTRDRVEEQARAKESQARIDRDVKRSIWELEAGRCKEYEAEIAKCKIYAPHDGLALYYIPEQVRRGGGSQQSIVAQGEPVRENQKLLQLPDLTHLQVEIRVHEALVPKVHPGQPAVVRLDAYPERALHGHVASVATFAAPPDWLSADVRVYPTKVVIDPEDVARLDIKPGLTAKVTLSLGGAERPVLTVPTEAIVGGSELGDERKVFVMTPDGPEERAVAIGASNGKVAEVKSGLDEGAEVIVNPTALLGE
jgi:multidrug resistance efflux pump